MRLIEAFRAQPRDAEVAGLIAGQLKQNAARTDRIFAVLLSLQWAAGILAAVFLSPLTWAGSNSSTHQHVYAAISLGALISGFPIWQAVFRPGRRMTRHSIAIGQMLTSALLIHLLGGRIEAHFHIFGSLAFLAFYLDASVLLTATLVTLFDHIARGAFYPQSIYGILTPSNWRWAEHAAWVVFENLFLLAQCRIRLAEMTAIADAQATLQQSHRNIEGQIAERTTELAEARDQALDSAKQKSAFLSMVTHEFRTPMNGLMGVHRLMRNMEINDEQRELIELADGSCSRLMRRVTDILDQSALDGRQITLKPAARDFIAWLSEVEKKIALESRAHGLDFTHSHRGFELIEAHDLEFDKDRLQQCLQKLVDNALAFTKVGALSLRSSIKQSTTAIDQLEIEIALQDTGPGIDLQLGEKLFQPFVQADSTLSRAHEGLGLGLTIARGLVALMGGTLQGSNVEGAGACFWVNIPMRRVLRQARQEALATPTVPKPAAQSRDLTHETILIVDDNKVNLKLAKRLVEKAGFATVTAENGQQALDQASQQDFALILMDCQMPVMDGHEATRRIRQLAGARGQVAIIAVTANCSSEDRELAFACGMDEFLEKPLDLDMLQNAMQAWASQKHVV